MRHIVYQGRKYKRVILNISGTAPFHEILKRINGLTIPDSPHDDEHIRYAILELINNSLRAHREKKVADTIKTQLRVDAEELKISIVDRGGGFDMTLLPYDIQEAVEGIDTESGQFQEYRERSGYRRFGIGLIAARRLFPFFKVSFYDESGGEIPYDPENVLGTRIDMGIRWKDV